ncbi:LuxR C-terminal-related transcriptional regulator [Amycolatopsis australiensis]|uniref:GAF domain-containing protein n=1 Tax=Amycolatopsis australiensis TaxID=546364 RepID=A0A1K1S631_9PSEU|nr:LuxR C-terminal-related transcriptional regulator [Amycolatopsis australiensis]SFW79811.1 GAF domain-containing protein [Amycolatopsis australiensis]
MTLDRERPGPPGAEGAVLGADLGARLEQLAGEVGAALDREFPAPRQRAGTALRSLAAMWDAVLAETLHAAEERARPARQAELTLLLSRIREAESAVTDFRLADGAGLLHRIRAALAEVRDAAGVEDLLTRVPEACLSLGFDRALVSQVEDSVWKLHTMAIIRDPRMAEEMVAAGKADPPALDGSLVETDVVDQGKPGLVFDVQNNPRVARKLVRISHCSSYGVAPLTVQGEVVGLLHGDCYHQRRDVDATDRAVLNLFAEGVSQTLGRVTVLDGLSTLAEGIGRLATTARLPAPRPEPPPAAAFGLTRREAEIAELLAAGESNQAIARRLYISEGTVKTHVTHVLRKLGAANRAEAVSRWLRRDR